MKRIGYSILLVVVVMLTGCSNECVSALPIATPPSHHVLNKIGSLHDAEVDQWMTAEYKLHQKLKVK